VVFCISDFIAAGFEPALQVASRRHDLIAVSVTDPRELDLPDIGLVEFEDPETGESALIDTRNKKARDHFKTMAGKRVDSLRKFFLKNGIDEIPVSTESDYVESLVKFFKKREKLVR
jgi:uncharacterized protein (DUF58 family)